MAEVKLKDLIAPAFYELHKLIKEKKFYHYWIKGGRGSTKSSFISIEIIINILKDPNAHAVCFRKIGNKLEKSVYNQVKWAVNALGLRQFFKFYKNPLQIEYLPTGQLIFFLGLDDPENSKSMKIDFGYIKLIWFEELNQFDGIAEIRKVRQSAIRGGDEAIVFYSYNPPQTVANWVNKECNKPEPNRYIHHSTYLDVPPEWLGKPFIAEAEALKATNPTAYAHEYLGEITGTGLNVFSNITVREITDEEISHFDNIREGIDWGYAADPFAFLQMHYNAKYKKLYIFNEIYEYGMLNTKAMELVNEKHNQFATIIADSEDPKSIGEFWDYGFNIRGAKKGPGSRGFGFKFLQDMSEIIIDPVRCPNCADEFQGAEFELNKDDTIRNEYPDKNDHTIDTARYALEEDMPISLRK